MYAGSVVEQKICSTVPLSRVDRLWRSVWHRWCHRLCPLRPTCGRFLPWTANSRTLQVIRLAWVAGWPRWRRSDSTQITVNKQLVDFKQDLYSASVLRVIHNDAHIAHRLFPTESSPAEAGSSRAIRDARTPQLVLQTPKRRSSKFRSYQRRHDCPPAPDVHRRSPQNISVAFQSGNHIRRCHQWAFSSAYAITSCHF